MRGRVVNKIARWNAVFDEENSEPDYINGKSRIIAFDNVPVTLELRNILPRILSNANNLKCEGNYYYDLNSTYIGFHGDSERTKVIGVRLGNSMPLWFRWFCKFKPLSENFIVSIFPGRYLYNVRKSSW
jgi:hypothetical protein